MPSHCTCTTSGCSDRTRRSRRTALGPYSSPFSTTRARVRGDRRSSRDDHGRKISSRVYPSGSGTSPCANGDVEQRDLVPAPRQRGRERVVVRRREARRVEEGDPAQASASGTARPQAPAAGRPSPSPRAPCAGAGTGAGTRAAPSSRRRAIASDECRSLARKLHESSPSKCRGSGSGSPQRSSYAIRAMSK